MTPRIVSCLVGDSYKPSFATVTGNGDNPIYIYINIYIYLYICLSNWEEDLLVIHPPVIDFIGCCGYAGKSCDCAVGSFILINLIIWIKLMNVLTIYIFVPFIEIMRYLIVYDICIYIYLIYDYLLYI